MHTQLCEKLNKSFGLIFRYDKIDIYHDEKNKKKIGHRESVSKLSVLIHVGRE